MRYLLLLSFVFLSCEKAVEPTPEPVQIATTFRGGVSSVQNTPTGGARGITNIFDLTQFKRIEVLWTTNQSPYPAPQSDTYTSYVYRPGYGDTRNGTIISSTETRHRVIIESFELPNRDSVVFEIWARVGSSANDGAVTITIHSLSILGWE